MILILHPDFSIKRWDLNLSNPLYINKLLKNIYKL